MTKGIVVAALALVSLPLSGCTSLFGGHLFAARAPAAQTVAAVDMSDYFQERLAVGKAQLERGQVSQAIDAFRQASYDPAVAGSAYNGMAVAYAQLGRDDLAERYFAQAVAADPADPRFARNLARLAADRGTALAEAAPAAPTNAVPVTAAPAPAAAVQTAAQTAPRIHAGPSGVTLVRVSSGEVRIGHSEDTPAAMLTAQAAPPVHVAARQQLPLRMALPPTKLALAATRGPSYPVRVSLQPPR